MFTLILSGNRNSMITLSVIKKIWIESAITFETIQPTGKETEDPLPHWKTGWTNLQRALLRTHLLDGISDRGDPTERRKQLVTELEAACNGK